MGLFSRRKKEKPHPYCSAVVAAAGSGERMQGENKLFAPLCGVPVLARTLLALEDCPEIDEIVIAARADELGDVEELCAASGITKAVKIVPGGENRTDSVWAGVMAASKRAELIAIQDGARPLATRALILEALRTAAEYAAAAPAVPVKDTIKTAKGGVVTGTPERAELFAVQTPQVFRSELIKAALAKAMSEKAPLTDDCAAVERLGAGVRLTRGDEENIKITTPGDLVIAEAILKRRRGE